MKDTASALAAFGSTPYGAKILAQAAGTAASTVGLELSEKALSKVGPVMGILAGGISLVQNVSKFDWSLSSTMSIAGDVTAIVAGGAAVFASTGGLAAALGAGSLVLTLGAEVVKGLERNWKDSEQMQQLLMKCFGEEVGGIIFHAREDALQALDQTKLDRDSAMKLAQQDPALMRMLLCSPDGARYIHQLDGVRKMYGLPPERFGDILSSLDKGLAADSTGDLEAMHDLIGPAFDGVRTRRIQTRPPPIATCCARSARRREPPPPQALKVISGLIRATSRTMPASTCEATTGPMGL
ncbi:hypothetical protein [Archangium lipolyticum]|uniref:hypothetical protein n=1 Tax=Archangium lipolyticum TaxID=2970465 RepID=UPI00214A5EBE|nr:hypothetical protein [Archangium lipolyticum]